jgi:transcriptional regulator with XRE-family HTH domain
VGKTVEGVGNAVETLGDYLREQRVAAKLSLRQLAEQTGVSNPYLSQIERGLRRPSAEVLQQLAKGLRISAETLYVRAGFLDEGHSPSDVTAAVLADPAIGERHKRVLLDIYESFRAEHAAGLQPAPAKRPAPRKTAARKTAATKKTAKRSAATKSATTTSATTAARTTNSRRSS